MHFDHMCEGKSAMSMYRVLTMQFALRFPYESIQPWKMVRVCTVENTALVPSQSSQRERELDMPHEKSL